MAHVNPPSTAKIGGQPLHARLVSFPIGCFVATFVTDLIYWRTAAGMWETFSIWLLTFGLIGAVPAILTGLIDFAGSARVRALRPAWPHALGNGLAILLSLVNAFVHSRDGYTAVVPTGLVLSGLVVLILACTGWLGGEMVYRHHVGAAD
jgi:uncharacterized membrane protein